MQNDRRIVSRVIYFYLSCVAGTIFAETGASAENPLRYYENEFIPRKPYQVYDTLFEKIIWHRKVSHLVLGEHNGKHRVTLLMIEEYPYSYKGLNYPIHFEFDRFDQASKQLAYLDQFLRKNGVMAVGLKGNTVSHSRVLAEPR